MRTHRFVCGPQLSPRQGSVKVGYMGKQPWVWALENALTQESKNWVLILAQSQIN